MKALAPESPCAEGETLYLPIGDLAHRFRPAAVLWSGIKATQQSTSKVRYSGATAADALAVRCDGGGLFMALTSQTGKPFGTYSRRVRGASSALCCVLLVVAATAARSETDTSSYPAARSSRGSAHQPTP
jgi:hypothetical protein